MSSAFASRLAAPLVLCVVVGCGGHSSSTALNGAGASAVCTVGDERCGCYPNDTCNGSLRCLSGLCVNDPDSSSGGVSGVDGGTAQGGLSSALAGGVSFAGTSAVAGSPSEASGGSNGDPNLIVNGDFSGGASEWAVTAFGAPTLVDPTLADGTLCFPVDLMAALVVVGWPQDITHAAQLFSGRTYALSYDVRSTGPLTVLVNAKVGRAALPFTEDFSGIDEPGTDNVSRTFTHTKTLTADDPEAGVALQVNTIGTAGSSTVCFDNVSLVEVK